MLKVAKVISEEEMSADTVHLGSKVKVYDKEFDEEVTYLIVGTAEASPSDGKISGRIPHRQSSSRGKGRKDRSCRDSRRRRRA